jgi:hypothetical protein
MLPLARYRFHLRTESPLRLPVWAGSTLRGAFGHALRRLACMTRAPECPGCPLHSTCPYPGIFAPPPVDHTLQKFGQPPRPYIIEPAFWGESHFAVGDSLYFDLVLVGRALRELPLVALAWQRALAHGIGPGGGTATISTISKIAFDGESKVVFTIEDGIIQRHDTPAPQPPEPAVAGQVTLRFTSPLRLLENDRALPPGSLTPRTLLLAIARRASLMAEFHGAGAPGWDFRELVAAAATVDGEKRLEWKDWIRRSARQQQTMHWGGVVGEWTLRGNLTPFLPALHIGQWLHVGKETVFGLGRYVLEQQVESSRMPPPGP